jgi:hypothetical protein
MLRAVLVAAAAVGAVVAGASAPVERADATVVSASNEGTIDRDDVIGRTGVLDRDDVIDRDDFDGGNGGDGANG